MSRGVRDLRDLICVSRLTFHAGEEEEIFSSDDEKVHSTLTKLSVSSENAASKFISSRVASPDSGFSTNNSPGICCREAQITSDDSLKIGSSSIDDNFEGTSSSASSSKVTKNEKKRRKKKMNQSKPELPCLPPLPPVLGIQDNVIDSRHQNPAGELLQRSQPNRSKLRANFDDVLPYMDAIVVASWLTRSNVVIQELSSYCNMGDNFVNFSHFWLSEFPDLQKKEILSMEYDILLDEITLAFAVGIESGKVVRRDVLDICGAVFKEYPVRLLGTKGSYAFLDYLDVLSAEKEERFKKLLSDMCCSTSNRQYAQWLLATRSFAVVNVWSAVVNFYRNLMGEQKIQVLPVLDLCSTKESVPQRRILQAIRLGHIDVINYLISAGHVSPDYSDFHGRSLLFTAVMHNQTAVIGYLMTQDLSVRDINKPADTGNTVLHAASNSGNLAIVELLCQCENLDVNCVNRQCEKATPLHLAVMHGHMKVVECLLKHGADPSLRMGGASVQDLAREFDHGEILALLDK